MTDLTEFLLARIAEDDEQARRHFHAANQQGWGSYVLRVMVESEAKRRIVVRCQEMQTAAVPMAVHLATRTLADLALPYADHPDYDEAWRP